MKNITTLILFCLLLPRGVCGQGISISDNFRSDRSLIYDDRYKPSGKYRLYRASVYTKNNVRKVELFQDGNNMPFMLTFDKQGRIIKSKNCASSSDYTIITDSIFEFGKTTIIDSFFYRNELTRIDTLIINKVEIRRRNNKTISYDRAFYKSYKSGAYINGRIEEYKQIKEGGGVGIIRQIKYIDHGYYTLPRRVDGNVDGSCRNYYRKRAAPATTPILRIRPYLPKKFYLAQKKTFYINNTDKLGYLCLRDKVRCFVEGEDGPGVSYLYAPNYGPHCGGSRHYPPPIEEEKRVYNNNLLDTVFKLTYYEQAEDKPCVKPKDSLFTDYLRGYSGEPQKHIKYYFRYEYFGS